VRAFIGGIQCAAARMCVGDIMVPPQMCEPRMLNPVPGIKCHLVSLFHALRKIYMISVGMGLRKARNCVRRYKKRFIF
jgi:hypothetical protein